MSLKSSVTAGAGATFKCLYPTTAVQATYQMCRVGGLQTTTTFGCLNPALEITITESGVATTTIAAGTNPTITNKAGRTLQGFATTSTVTSKMYSGCAGCPYATFMDFYNYYGDLDYADKWVLAALDATSLTYTNGQAADFSSTTGANVYTRVDAVKKGTAYMNNWMYIIREFEDAIDDCTTSSIDNNYDAAHAWDEGVAFWTGSLEGTDGSGSGKMVAALADKRCQNFATCGAAGTATTGTAKVNVNFFALSAEARDYLYGGRCSRVRPVVTAIVKQMAVPLLQGTLRYAWKVATNGPSGSNTNAAGSNTLLKENAEGAIFAHAVLPLIHKVSASAATTVYTNMKIGSFSPDKAAVKSAIESVLPAWASHAPTLALSPPHRLRRSAPRAPTFLRCRAATAPPPTPRPTSARLRAQAAAAAWRRRTTTRWLLSSRTMSSRTSHARPSPTTRRRIRSSLRSLQTIPRCSNTLRS